MSPARPQSRAEAQAEKIRSLMAMAASLGHDYNNFLTAVQGNARILQRRLDADDSSRRNADQIDATAKQALELTGDILIFGGKGHFEMAEFSLTDLVHSLRETMQERVSKHAVLEISVDDVPPLTGDARQLGRAIMHLVENAAESIVEDTGTVSVTVSTRTCDREELADNVLREPLEEGRYAVVEVSDDGCGMDCDLLDRMFEPFFTTKLRAHGMGLPVALGVARAHGGTVKVKPSPEGGCTVTLLLPCTPTPQ